LLEPLSENLITSLHIFIYPTPNHTTAFSDLSEISRGRGGERWNQGRVIFFSAIEKGRVRTKLARSFYMSDTNLKETGGGSQTFQPFARGG